MVLLANECKIIAEGSITVRYCVDVTIAFLLASYLTTEPKGCITRDITNTKC